MSCILSGIACPFLAATDATVARTVYELALPQTPFQWLLAAAVLALVFSLVVAIYWRDTHALPGFWTFWLTGLRIAVLVAMVVIAVDPKVRTQKLAYRPSHAVLLVDRSLSMQLPDGIPSSENGAEATGTQSRTEAIRGALESTPLLQTLRKVHDVSVYSFDSKLNGPHHLYRAADRHAVRTASPTTERSDESEPADATESAGSSVAKTTRSPDRETKDWTSSLEPRGLETRLGESLLDLIRQVNGKTLSGIVILTDGASNAGLDPTAANSAAKAAKVRLITVGVGSLEQPVNLQIVNVQAPTDVQVGDAFELSAFVQGQGLGQDSVHVELLRKPADDAVEPMLVESRDVTLFEDGVPVEVKFKRNPSAVGETEYLVRVRPARTVRELSTSDNERRKTVNMVDRRTRVLLIAGGPTREYRFVRNMLYRHSAIELDAWLQTVDAGTAVSQDTDRLIYSFPSKRDELFQYDIVITFDPDWRRIPPESIRMLQEWVFSQSGGLILVAGDVHTPEFAGTRGELKPLHELYPVVLTPHLLDYQLADESQQVWPISLTRAANEAGFLHLTDDPISSSLTWQEFPGVYRCYPTSGAKAGATVYARHSDPRSQTEFGPPILMASQFYGSGRVFYLGTSEFWRLRSVDEEYYDRFWTKLVREAGQSRLQQGTNRGLLLLERNEYLLGQTITVRVQLLDPQFHPWEAPAVNLEVYTPAGKPLVPPRQLLPDKNRPGQFVGNFRASVPGTYRLELAIPQSKDVLTKKLDVGLPNQESNDARQNAQLLRNLVEDTGGAYLTLGQMAKELPKWLPNRGEEYLVDDRLQTLWDREWVMYVLVVLLSIEWLTRKLLKLA